MAWMFYLNFRGGLLCLSEVVRVTHEEANERKKIKKSY